MRVGTVTDDITQTPEVICSAFDLDISQYGFKGSEI
jgi:hypothetical protein